MRVYHKRRKRRGNSRSHASISGRTGSVKHKQRAGLLHELKKHRKRAARKQVLS